MNKNRQKAKNKVIQSEAAGEVVMDIMTLHAQMTGTDPVSAQYVKNLVNLVKKMYSVGLSGAPTAGPVVQIDLEDSIAEIQGDQGSWEKVMDVTKTIKDACISSSWKNRLLVTCVADRDGDCYHKDCPQIRDNEPATTGRHCPIDTIKDPYE